MRPKHLHGISALLLDQHFLVMEEGDIDTLVSSFFLSPQRQHIIALLCFHSNVVAQQCAITAVRPARLRLSELSPPTFTPPLCNHCDLP
jgi:hypothetical protein